MADNPLAYVDPAIDPANSLASGSAADPFDYTARYNTKLNPAQESLFQAWAAKSGKLGDLYDYDMRGQWQAGQSQKGDEHGTDTFKKPNHPTFSNQSQYHGTDGHVGGVWGGTDTAPTFTPSATNLKMMSPAALQRYFRTREPDVRLVMPPNTPQQ